MPWDTLALSVVLYIVIPVIVAQHLRRWWVSSGSEPLLARILAALQPLSLAALLATQPLAIGLLAVPILIQVYFNAGLAYFLNRFTGELHCVAGPSALPRLAIRACSGRAASPTLWAFPPCALRLA